MPSTTAHRMRMESRRPLLIQLFLHAPLMVRYTHGARGDRVHVRGKSSAHPPSWVSPGQNSFLPDH